MVLPLVAAAEASLREDSLLAVAPEQLCTGGRTWIVEVRSCPSLGARVVDS
jgi:hypothetical protein